MTWKSGKKLGTQHYISHYDPKQVKTEIVYKVKIEANKKINNKMKVLRSDLWQMGSTEIRNIKYI